MIIFEFLYKFNRQKINREIKNRVKKIIKKNFLLFQKIIENIFVAPALTYFTICVIMIKLLINLY